MEKQKNKKIVKINASLELANKWKQNAKELNKSRSDYLLDIINKNNESKKWFSIEEVLKKFKKN